MPFAPGAAVYGYPKEGDGSLARLASAFHAVRPGETTYSPATYVYQWCSTGWQLVWGAAIAPPSGVTAAWVAAGTKVRVAWVAPSPNLATSYTVRRFDGSVVAQGVTALTVDDDSPTPGTGTYTVEAVNGTFVSTRAASPSLTIDLQPATVTAAASGETIVVSWTANATNGDPDQWRVYNATDGGWVSGLLAGNVRSFTTPAMTPGKVFTLAVYSFLSGVQGGGRNANAVGILPRVTRPQSWAASGISNLAYTFYGPDAGLADSYDIEYYISSWVPWIYGTTSGGPHNLSTTSCAYVRSRTNSQGMSSPWSQSGPTCPVNDVTGPPAVNVSVGDWSVAGAYWNVSWPAHGDSSGNSLTQLQMSVNGGGWQAVGNYPAGADYNINHNPGRGAWVQYRIYATDSLGNATTGPASASKYSRPLGSGIFYPNNSHTWGANAGWRTADDRCIGGAFGGQENYGFWFYGDQFLNWGGYAPDRMYFYLTKVSGLSSAGIAYIAGHNQGVDNGTVPGVGGIVHAPSLGTASSNELFGAGWYPYFANGTYKGFAVIGNGAAFKAIYGKSEDGNSGAVTWYFDQ